MLHLELNCRGGWWRIGFYLDDDPASEVCIVMAHGHRQRRPGTPPRFYGADGRRGDEVQFTSDDPTLVGLVARVIETGGRDAFGVVDRMRELDQGRGNGRHLAERFYKAILTAMPLSDKVMARRTAAASRPSSSARRPARPSPGSPAAPGRPTAACLDRA